MVGFLLFSKIFRVKVRFIGVLIIYLLFINKLTLCLKINGNRIKVS